MLLLLKQEVNILVEKSQLEEELKKLHKDSFAWAMTCANYDHVEAEDILQTTYEKIYDQRAIFEKRASFKTWLFGVIYYTSREFYRKKKVRDLALKKLFLKSPEEVEYSPEKCILDEELKSKLKTALVKLPRKQKEIIELILYHEMTIAEASEVMNIGLGSAKTHYHRAKKKLYELLIDLR